MTPKIETSIWLAIKSRIATIPLTYSKAWPGEIYRAPSSGLMLDPYLRIGRVSVAPVRMLIANGKPHERNGSIIITLVYPMSDKVDTAAYEEICGVISDHFKDGTCMTFNGVSVEVTAYPHVQDGYEDSGYWVAPVRIPWKCFA